MKTVSEEKVEAVWNGICDLDQEGTESLMREFFETQPFLAAYLAAMEEGLHEDIGEEGLLVPLALLCWKALAPEADPAEVVSGERIEEIEEGNMSFIGAIEEGSEMQMMDLTQKFFEGYNQRPLLEFILQVLMSESVEEPDMAPVRVGSDFFHLKTVIDCLDAR